MCSTLPHTHCAWGRWDKKGGKKQKHAQNAPMTAVYACSWGCTKMLTRQPCTLVAEDNIIYTPTWLARRPSHEPSGWTSGS